MFRLGTRKSKLAVVQSESIQKALRALQVETELVYIDSEGDQNLSQPLYQIETQLPGLFTKHLEQALLDKRIDLAVHSLKDLPTLQPEPLFVAAVPAREVVSDVLLIRPEAFEPGQKFNLRLNAHVGTSSLRREAQLLAQRNDLQISSVRGNVPTRVQKVRDGQYDAVVFALAGLTRLKQDMAGLERVVLAPEEFVSAPGQGALAVEARKDGAQELLRAIAQLHHAPTGRAVTIERRILRELEGGCTLPLGVWCEEQAGKALQVRAFLGLTQENASEKKRNWLGFRYFDISGGDDETLVAQTVKHFREWQKNGFGNRKK